MAKDKKKKYTSIGIPIIKNNNNNNENNSLGFSFEHITSGRR